MLIYYTWYIHVYILYRIYTVAQIRMKCGHRNGLRAIIYHNWLTCFQVNQTICRWNACFTNRRLFYGKDIKIKECKIYTWEME